MCYEDFLFSVGESSRCFAEYVDEIILQNQQYEALKQIDKRIDKQLKNLYDEI